MSRAVWLLTLPVLLAVPVAVWADDAPVSPDRAYVNAVIDAMVEGGFITAEQADAIKGQGLEAAQAASEQVAAYEASKPKPKKAWYDTMKISGYAQWRWLYYPDADDNASPGAIVKDNEFLLRRARFAIEAKPTENIKVYIQPDFGEGKVELRDYWIEHNFGLENTSRFRLGQQKIPFGYETPQSSSVRIPLERNWTARWTIPGERDTGLVYFYVTPEDKKLFDFGKSSAWGTGDYGTIAVGVFNGQGINVAEVNESKHFTIRAAKPFVFKWDEDGNDVFAEVGASYMAGDYVSGSGSSAVEHSENLLGIHGYVAPEPIGLQAEFYTGETEGEDVDGWYAMLLGRTDPRGVAFVRYDEHNGPRKGRGSAAADRERISLGYCYVVDDKTRLTVEYDMDDNVARDQNEDVFGIQVMTAY